MSIESTLELDCRSSIRKIRREGSNNDVDIRGPERLFPVFGAAFAAVSEQVRARSHSLLEFRRKAFERRARRAQRLEALVAESSANPSVAGRAGWMSRGGNDFAQPADQLPPGLSIVDSKDHISRVIWSGPRAQHSALNIIELEHGFDRHSRLKANRARDLERISLEGRSVRKFIEEFESHVGLLLWKRQVDRDSQRVDGVAFV